MSEGERWVLIADDAGMRGFTIDEMINNTKLVGSVAME